MRKFLPALLFLLCLVLTCVAVRADESAAPLFESGQTQTGMLLVSDDEILLVETESPESSADEIGGMRVTKSITVTAPSPHLAAGARVGLELKSGILEAGLEGFIFYFPPRDGAYGPALGTYVNFAPIPGNWGRRFYLQGKAYAAYGFGHPTYNALSFGAALGYRQPLKGKPKLGKPRYLFFEMGLEQAYLLKYKEVLYMLDVLKAGVTW